MKYLIKICILNPFLKNQIKKQESKLKNITDQYSHNLSTQSKADLHARKNRVIYCINELKKML